ncbi:MAG: c-type cytochrome [Opitutus sp.]|nr:c-type cytochrome [Opitutus sp.]
MLSPRFFLTSGGRLSAITWALAAPLISVQLPAQRGDAPDAKLISPTGERALFHVPPGFEVQLVAAEPDIQKPLNLAFDSAGRVWVTGSTLYPWPAKRDALGQPIASFEKQWGDTSLAFRAAATPPEPTENGEDSVRVLSDFGPDGRARKSTIFADGLNIPVGILPLPRAPGARGDSVLVYSIPAIWRLTDTDGDGRADRREKLYDGFGFKDTHGMSSSYWLWFDGWVYGTHGFANASEVTDRAGRVTKLTSGNTYRFRPDGSRFEVFVNGQTNPFGLAFDARGDLYTADSHSKPVYLLIPGGYYEGISKEHDGLGFAPAITTDDHGSSAIAGVAHYSAAQFPTEFHDNLFNGNPVTRRINRARLDWRGSTPAALRQPDFLASDDPAFRPVQVKLGPDGALWIADFYNPIIGHYEVPLTHPARDHGHGRIWRVVWRGLAGSVTAPALPNFAREKPVALAARLLDPNLVVRSLALAELLVRPDAGSAERTLHAAATRLVGGADAAADGTAALPLFFALDRLGRADDALLRLALTRPDSEVARAALRVLAARDTLPADAEELFSGIVGGAGTGRALEPRSPGSTAATSTLARPAVTPYQSAPGHSWRILADILTRRPQPWGAPLILAMLAKAPETDAELAYALRLALKTQALTADVATLREWSATGTAAAERVADVCLAVPTPAAAEFLLGHLEKTKFAGARAGEFAKHAALQLPPDGLSAIEPILGSLKRVPPSQRLAFAEGLAAVAAKTDRTLPTTVDAWMRKELTTALTELDAAKSLRAINALKPLTFPEKAAGLGRIALDTSVREANRVAALRALVPAASETEETAIAILSINAPHGLRRAAADVLGASGGSASVRAALTDAFSTASADLALGLAVALAKSDPGAADLLDLAAAGRVRATLLKHRYVATALAQRPEAVRQRAATLTNALPPEDARLDAVIAARLGAAGNHRPDATRGAPLFTAHCAACHRFRDTGGNLGPGLDGIGSRALTRLVEDILDPSRNVDPAFRLTSVTLKNGESKSGMNFREEPERVLLADPATGQDVAVLRTEVVATTVLPNSPMPATFETALSESEFFDLIEYLRRPAK